MASELTSKTVFRGFAILDPACTDSTCIWAAQSSYDQAGNVAGVPDDQDGSSMVLHAIGTQDASSTMRVRTQRGGFPGTNYSPTSSGWPATYIHRNADSGDWYGRIAPTVLMGYEHVAANPTRGHNNKDVILLQSGDLLQVGNNDNAPATEVASRRYDSTTNAWQSPVLIVAEVLTSSGGPHCSLYQLPSGRILCVYTREDTLDTTLWQLDVQYSDDDGATWAYYSRGAYTDTDGLIDSDDVTITRVRARFNAATGEVLLLVWGTHDTGGGATDRLYQYASDDFGANFTYVAAIDATDADDVSITGDVVVHDGVFVVVSCNSSATASVNGHYVYRLGSAFEPIGDGAEGDPVNTSANFLVPTTAGENRFCMVLSDTGVIWAYSANTNPTVDNTHCFYSQDGGITWDNGYGGTLSTLFGSCYAPGVSTVFPTETSAAWHRGRVVMLCNHDSPTTSSDDDNLSALYFGTQSNVTMPYRGSPGSTITARRMPGFEVSWERHYLPFELPGNDGWSKSSGGTNSEAITAGGLVLTTTSGNINYLVVAATSTTDGYLARSSASCDTGTADMYWGRIVNAGGTAHYIVSVELTPTDINVIDSPNGARNNIGTAAHGGGRVEVHVSQAGDSVRVWWRDWDSDENKGWSEITISGALSDLGATAASDIVRFGIVRTLTTTATFYEVSFVSSDRVGEGLDGFTNPDDLIGAPYGAGLTSASYVDEGVSVYAVDGPTAAGEDWNINTRYTYPIESIHPTTAPSPAKKWRSSSTTASMAIAWQTGDFALNSTNFGSQQYLLWLDGINFRQFQIQTYQSSTWTDVATVANYLSVSFVRVGQRVGLDPTGTATGAEWIEWGELVGGYIEFPNGDVRKITAHTSGTMEAGAVTSPKIGPVFYCEDIDNGEDVTGTAKFWFPRAAVLLQGHVTGQAVRIQINDDASPVAPPEGYFTIGSMFYGPALLFGRDYSFGSTRTITPNTEVITAPDGSRRTRVRGQPRRSVSVQFPAIDTTPFSGDSALPDVYVTQTSTVTGSYTVADEPVRLPGILEYCRGAHRPVVWLPYVAKFGALETDRTLNYQRARGAFMGRIIGGLSLTHIAGDEQSTGVVSVAGLTIEEEV